MRQYPEYSSLGIPYPSKKRKVCEVLKDIPLVYHNKILKHYVEFLCYLCYL